MVVLHEIMLHFLVITPAFSFISLGLLWDFSDKARKQMSL